MSATRERAMDETNVPRGDIAEWAPLAELAEVTATAPVPLAVTVGGVPWVLVVLDGGVSALYDVCPHRRVPLSAGTVVSGPSGDVLECGYHGWSYDRRGACSRIPALGENVVPRGMGSVRVLRTHVAAGLVWGSDDEAADPPTGLDDGDVFLRVQEIALPAAVLHSRLGSSPGAAPVWHGADAHGLLRYAIRAIDPERSAVFPLVSADRLSEDVPAWVARLATLPRVASSSHPADPHPER